MRNNNEQIILMDSPEAASIQTVTGWVDRQGRFWGKDEHQARWSGATHRKCRIKPEEHPIHATNSYCEACHQESRQALYADMERVEWKGEPLVIFDTETYFFDTESIVDYCLENSQLPSEMQLVICIPNYPPEFDIVEHCEEIIPDGDDFYAIPETVREAAAALNEAIKKSEPVSWSGGKQAAKVSDCILTNEKKAKIIVNSKSGAA